MSIIKTSKLNVGAVYVSDLDVSLKFYTEILGFTIKDEMAPGYLLTLNDGFSLYIEGGLRKKNFTMIWKYALAYVSMQRTVSRLRTRN